MLESIVSFLPSGWFSLSVWPGFGKWTVMLSKIHRAFASQSFILLTITKMLHKKYCKDPLASLDLTTLPHHLKA